MEPGSSWGVSCCGFFTIFDIDVMKSSTTAARSRECDEWKPSAQQRAGTCDTWRTFTMHEHLKRRKNRRPAAAFINCSLALTYCRWLILTVQKKNRSSVLHIWIKPADHFMFLKLTKVSGDVVNDAKKNLTKNSSGYQHLFFLNQYVRSELLGNCVVHNLISSKSF